MAIYDNVHHRYNKKSQKMPFLLFLIWHIEKNHVFCCMYDTCLLYMWHTIFNMQLDASDPGTTASDMCISFVYQLQDALFQFQVSLHPGKCIRPGIIASWWMPCIRSWNCCIWYVHLFQVDHIDSWNYHISYVYHIRKNRPPFCPFEKHKKIIAYGYIW